VVGLVIPVKPVKQPFRFGVRACADVEYSGLPTFTVA